VGVGSLEQRKKHIGFYIENYVTGGLERFLFDLMAELSAREYGLTLFWAGDDNFVNRFEKTGLRGVELKRVRVLSTKPWEDRVWKLRPPKLVWRFFIAGMDVLRWIFFYRNIGICRRSFHGFPLDVMHVVNGGYPAARSCLSAVVAANKERFPLVLYSLLGNPRPRIWWGVEKWIDRWVIHSINVVACCCNSGAQLLKSHRGFPDDKVAILHHGLRKMEKLNPEEISSLRSRFHLNGDMVIGNVSVMEYSKGQQFLIEAMVPLVKTFPQMKCLIVGDGKERKVLEDLARNLGVGERVIFTGHVPQDPAAYMALMNVFVHPSLDEGLPYVIFEAMSLGLPIVSSNVGGIPEQITDGKSGLLVPPGNPSAIAEAVTRCLTHPQLARDLGRNAYEKHQSSFTMEQMLCRVEHLYEGETR
jgi:glycosyltransferase involved in cell wall biosynthesis